MATMADRTRSAQIARQTKETDVQLTLTLDGTGAGERATGVGFLDHMLDLLARHGRLDLDVQVKGDLDTGSHHTVEDTGICLGQALDAALGDRRGIARYGQAIVPMDEALATCAIDVSGRPFCRWSAELHLRVDAGTNAHHMIEAAFKAFARALRAAVAVDPTETGVPSTKGTLT
jgi:imidazoleglycerol-phosphate dehydratase